MSNIPIKSIKFPGLSDTYTFTQLDSTLSVSGKAADAKVTGDELDELNSAIGTLSNLTTTAKTNLVSAVNEVDADITDVKEDLNQAIEDFAVPTQEAVDNWLNTHPESTTTVQDHSLTYEKLVPNTLNFVTPEMFGAKGDGVTDDTDAMNNCFHYGNIKLKSGATYFVDYIDITSDSTVIDGNGATIKFNSNRSGQTIGETSNIYKTECLSNRRSSTSQFDSFVIRDVSFDGGGASFSNYSDYDATYTSLITLQLFNYKNVVIDACHFYDTIQDAVWLGECEIVSISNCKFEQIAINTRLSGTKNAITVGSASKTSALIIQHNSFSYVYDECMRINNYSVAKITNNTAYHCYQYFAELFFNRVNGYSCDFNFTGNTINELADSFINVSSVISTTLQLNIVDNVIKGLGSANISDNDHSTVYYCSVLNCGYNSDINVILTGNHINHENSSEKTAPLINALYSYLVMKDNTIVLSHNVSSTSALINAKKAVIDGNEIAKGTSYEPSYTTFIAGINPFIHLINNNINVIHERTIAFNTSDSAEIHIINNSINGITSSGNLIRTKSADVVPYVLVSKNIIKSGKYLTYQGMVNNLIYTGNILPSSFLLPSTTTFTNKIEANNLLTV